MNSQVMKLCPFCGSDEIMDMQHDGDFWVQCSGCNCSTQVYEFESEAHAAWNTRATPAPIPDAGGEVLTPALRQYLHNDGSGLVAGYDLELTQRIVSALQASSGIPDGLRADLCTMLAASTTPGDSK